MMDEKNFGKATFGNMFFNVVLMVDVHEGDLNVGRNLMHNSAIFVLVAFRTFVAAHAVSVGQLVADRHRIWFALGQLHDAELTFDLWNEKWKGVV